MTKLITTFFIFILITACTKKTDSSHPGVEKTFTLIKKQRAAKDEAFKSDTDSPIPDSLKTSFTGLNYFPINLKYRFQLRLDRHENPEIFKIVTSAGNKRDAQKIGHFDFVIDGEDFTLQVYKLLDIQSRFPGYLFMPFTDATTNVESYGGGRYLDFKENTEGIYEVDFNLAYNPSCAYGKDIYNCPIPPKENKLPIAIRAGEKAFSAGAHQYLNPDEPEPRRNL